MELTVVEELASDECFTAELLRLHPLLDLRLASFKMGLIVFSGGVASRKTKAAKVALEIYQRSGGKYLNLENRSDTLTPEEWSGVWRSAEPLIYFGTIYDGETWIEALNFANAGYGVIACIHAINDDDLAEEIEEMGLPRLSVIQRIKQLLAMTRRYRGMDDAESHHAIDEWVDYLTSCAPYLEVRMGESAHANIALTRTSLVH